MPLAADDPRSSADRGKLLWQRRVHPTTGDSLLHSLWFALIPGLLWLALLRRARGRSPSPFALAVAFLLGAFAVTPAGFILILGNISYTGASTPAAQLEASLWVALSEECCKLLAVLVVALSSRSLRDRLDGTLCAISVGLGFACLESALYVSRLGEGVLLIRAFTAVLAHAAFTGIAGYYLGRAREQPRLRVGLIAKGLALAVALHAAYDTLLALSSPSATVAIALGVLLLTTLAGALALLQRHLSVATEWARIRRLLKL